MVWLLRENYQKGISNFHFSVFGHHTGTGRTDTARYGACHWRRKRGKLKLYALNFLVSPVSNLRQMAHSRDVTERSLFSCRWGADRVASAFI
ncbi:hypothetical protein T10_13073 [Trichinella papuae]|uniref:Uncharacterized protein n=1 Tax=Trichinella papuae TaxID=268474 RepID=A0A0V1MW37_9BILA|nr:hypothetical protein T10_13073 [Trichinella papuae]